MSATDSAPDGNPDIRPTRKGTHSAPEVPNRRENRPPNIRAAPFIPPEEEKIAFTTRKGNIDGISLSAQSRNESFNAGVHISGRSKRQSAKIPQKQSHRVDKAIFGADARSFLERVTV